MAPGETTSVRLVSYQVRSFESPPMPIPYPIYEAFQNVLKILINTRQRNNDQAHDLRRKRSMSEEERLHRLKREFFGDARYAPSLPDENAHVPIRDELDGVVSELGPVLEEVADHLRHAFGAFARLEGMDTPTVVKTEEKITVYHPPRRYFRKVIEALARDKQVILFDAEAAIDRLEADWLVDRCIFQIAINQIEASQRAGLEVPVGPKDLQRLRLGMRRIDQIVRTASTDVEAAYRRATLTELVPYRNMNLEIERELFLFEDSLVETEDLLTKLIIGDDVALLYYTAVNHPIEGKLGSLKFRVESVRPVVDTIREMLQTQFWRRAPERYREAMLRFAPAMLVFLDFHKMERAMSTHGAAGAKIGPWAQSFSGVEEIYHPLHAAMKGHIELVPQYVNRALEMADQVRVDIAAMARRDSGEDAPEPEAQSDAPPEEEERTAVDESNGEERPETPGDQGEASEKAATE